MLFNSFIFWAFLAVVLWVHSRLSHRAQNLLLLVSSYVFYAAWNWKYLSLILISTLLDYHIGRGMGVSRSDKGRKLLLALSICVNLGLLATFKYYNFFIAEFATLCESLGFQAHLPTFTLLLPIGISFYTFQTMGYTIDVYRRRISPETSLLNFALYVCFFPQLVAGPIERFERLMPQIRNPRQRTSADWVEGFYHILIGLYKKIVIADNMALIANAIFATPTKDLSGLDCFLGVVAFTFQIYGDFSGYSSIAQGVAKWLGFDLMYNFKMPYWARNPSDFWRRWHISLSTWLRDYVYIALGGNRRGNARTYRNLMLTMALGGLWHGAGWTFVCWGVYHGVLLCIYRPFERIFKPDETKRRPMGNLLAIPVMFLLTALGWLFFRATSMEQVGDFLWRMATNWDVTPLTVYASSLLLFFIGPLMLYEYILYRKGDDMLWLLEKARYLRAPVYTYWVLMLLSFYPKEIQEFIYFQF